MRIAICLSGQPRTWKKCISSWNSIFSRLKLECDAEIDIFCHLWDYNTPPNGVLSRLNGMENVNGDFLSVRGTKISEEEKNSLIEALNPKYIVFDDEIKNKSKIIECLEENKKYFHKYGDSKLVWAAGQFYSIMASTYLKRKYEMENKFRYDICFRMRCDLFLEDDEINKFFNRQSNQFTPPKHNNIYSCHTLNMKFGDIFFYGDSVTFDRVCDFYRWIPIMGTKTFPTKYKTLGTEDALYFYVKMLRIDINPLNVGPKIFRQENYLELKQKIGLMEGLGGYEII